MDFVFSWDDHNLGLNFPRAWTFPTTVVARAPHLPGTGQDAGTLAVATLTHGGSFNSRAGSDGNLPMLRLADSCRMLEHPAAIERAHTGAFHTWLHRRRHLKPRCFSRSDWSDDTGG